MPERNSSEFQNPGIDPSFLRERELASRWQMSTRTLQRWRAENYGPAYVRIGGAIRYLMDDILAYEARGRVGKGAR